MKLRKTVWIFAIILCAAALIGAVSYGASRGSLGFLSGQFREKAQNSDLTQVAATYNNHEILLSVVRYQQEMNILRTEEDAKDWDTDREAIDRIVESIILLEEAERRGLTATEEEIESMVETARKAYEIPAGKEFLEEYCAGAGITIKEYYDLLRKEAPSVIARQKLRDDVGRAYCEEHGLKFTKVNPPADMLDAVDAYIRDLFSSQKQHIIYHIEG